MAPQDTYIDDEEDCCPLCIEEFDLSDRNFRPCPCGYQICQFCFNNIRNNMNGLCPACRRPYDDKTIQWKMVTQEEIAEFQRNIQKNQKKRAAEQRQREAQKREAEKENRKNLVGVRVVQKNLVYVTGLTPTVREEELLKSLRRHEFFGQYGNILKISISSRKGNDGQNQSLGVYVTFEKKEDAARCILAVNGSQNGDRILRAQLGTTKYCSAWLRHEQCTNRQCMFLHELGDEEDSYSRQDLSSMNSISSQRPIQNPGTSRSASRQQVHQSPAPALAQPMVRSSSKDGSDNGDAPALPPSANWARNPQVRSRRGSHATSGAAPSPAISSALPATAESAVEEASADSPAAGPSTKATPSANLSKPPTPPAQKAKRASQDALKSLLKSLESCSLKWPKLANEDELSKLYPPLFDSRGGMRRRAMRAAEDTSSVGDQQSGGAREASEGEPESSGSLALGGEPEDRDHSRDPHSYDPHRIAQPPIQRSNTEGLFGQAVGASFTAQTTANLGSVGARTMTPQQPAFMRQPGAFVDHLSAQANLFQGQGHNRQGSRFSFANDGRDAASATSVKLTANPRIMAQQSSMMPSSFHNQPGSQYYASSMPGPPPGLKSTGTPPGVFGQHGFGSAAFGGASKDSNEILQLFGRGRAAGTQAHEAVKRELMFYPFPNQYPPSTSSTPAPASSRLAMLYGSQPGAFQDLGSKQKKKGKKHRHANTSSSGGSGSADLADPSILQATRMQSQQHLQQQSNAALGQGLFGGQSQDDDLLAMDEVRTSIEALVADEPIDANIRQPPGTFEPFGRLKTPSVPPGLGLPSAHPSPAVSHSSLQATSTGRHTPPVALPKVPVKPPVATVSSPLSGKKTIAQPVTEAKKNIKALAAENGLSKEINSKAKSQKLLQDEEFPALGSPKPQRAATPVVQPKAPAGKAASAGSKKPAEKTKDVDTAKEEPVSAPARGETPKPVARAAEKIPEKTAEKKVEKRPVPGILNIAAATKAAQMKNAEAQSTDKSAADRDSAFPALPTPTAASVSSPLARTAPKTLRVVSTPKTETPSTPVNGPASILAAPVARAVAAAAIRPETPASELISDSASIISASISASRTNSPPPSKIGSAPMRTTTKSQQRKQRKEALKKEAATISAQPAKAEPAEIAPIIGRKKKQKKDKPNSRNATPTESSSENPLAPQTMPADEVKENDEVKDAKEVKEVKEVKEIKEVKEVREVKEESSTYRSTANETTTLTDEPHNRYGDLKGKMAEARKNLDHSTTPRIMPTPAAVLRDLQEAGLVSGNIDDLAFLKSVSAQLDKWKNDPNNAGLRDLAARNTMTPTKSIVTEDDQTALMAGNPVRKVVDGVRILLTPNGDCVRNLSPEEEDRFLELQQLVATSITNPAAFVSPRHEAGGGFSLIKGRAVPNGPPSYFPPGPGAYPSDPVNKIQREEAIYYINQYVLPRLNLNARDMSLPKAMSSWTTDPRGTAAQAAANLSSVAPWLYGGISPSSHGADVDVDVTADAAAPELNYPGPIGAFADPLHHIPHHLQPHSHPHFPHPGFAPYLDLPNGSPGSQPPLADEIRDSSANSGNNTNASTNKSPMSYHSPGPFGNVPLMSLEDAEQALAAARKETEKLEKSLNQLMKKNRKLLLSMAGGAASSASPTATAVLAGGAASGGGGH